MSDRRAESGQNLRAVLICPDAALAHQFLATAEALAGLTLAQHLDEYPAPQELTEKVRQMRSDAVLVDVGSDRSRALSLIAAAVENSGDQDVPVMSVVDDVILDGERPNARSKLRPQATHARLLGQ